MMSLVCLLVCVTHFDINIIFLKEFDWNSDLFSGHASVIVSMLQDTQNNDQRLTMLQLVEKLKTKTKNLGK